MLDAGKVILLKRGLQPHIDYAEEVNWGEQCKPASQAVLCLYSAGLFYGLAITISSFVHIVIPVHKKPVLADFPPLKKYFRSDDY